MSHFGGNDSRVRICWENLLSIPSTCYNCIASLFLLLFLFLFLFLLFIRTLHFNGQSMSNGRSINPLHRPLIHGQMCVLLILPRRLMQQQQQHHQQHQHQHQQQQWQENNTTSHKSMKKRGSKNNNGGRRMKWISRSLVIIQCKWQAKSIGKRENKSLVTRIKGQRADMHLLVTLLGHF